MADKRIVSAQTDAETRARYSCSRAPTFGANHFPGFDKRWPKVDLGDLSAVVASDSRNVTSPPRTLRETALRGNPRSGLPSEVTEWIQAQTLEVSEELLSTARKAVENAKKSESSELAQLWSDSEELMDAWLKDLDYLLERLR